jgi:hypothetical protein
MMPNSYILLPQGDFENISNDEQTLCYWVRETELEEGFRVITDLGTGTSGDPWIWYYDPKTNVSWLYSTHKHMMKITR